MMLRNGKNSRPSLSHFKVSHSSQMRVVHSLLCSNEVWLARHWKKVFTYCIISCTYDWRWLKLFFYNFHIIWFMTLCCHRMLVCRSKPEMPGHQANISYKILTLIDSSIGIELKRKTAVEDLTRKSLVNAVARYAWVDQIKPIKISYKQLWIQLALNRILSTSTTKYFWPQ